MYSDIYNCHATILESNLVWTLGFLLDLFLKLLIECIGFI